MGWDRWVETSRVDGVGSSMRGDVYTAVDQRWVRERLLGLSLFILWFRKKNQRRRNTALVISSSSFWLEFSISAGVIPLWLFHHPVSEWNFPFTGLEAQARLGFWVLHHPVCWEFPFPRLRAQAQWQYKHHGGHFLGLRQAGGLLHILRSGSLSASHLLW